MREKDQASLREREASTRSSRLMMSRYSAQAESIALSAVFGRIWARAQS